MLPTPVAYIQRCDAAPLSETVATAAESIGVVDRIRGCGHVLVKPNLVTDKPDYIARGANTSAEVLDAVLALLSPLVDSVSVVESETGTAVKGRRLEPTWELMGYDQIAAKWDANLVNLTHFSCRPFESPLNTHPSIELPEMVLDADLIVNLPKIKTHKYAGLTCAMKNLFGLVPDPRRIVLHRWLADIIAALALAFRERTICFVDGGVAMEGNGPLYGTPVDLGLSLACSDLISLDRLICELIGLPESQVPYLKKCPPTEPVNYAKGSLTVAEVHRPFRPVAFSLYRSFEKHLMASPLVHPVTSPWFQQHVSRHFRGLTEKLRGGGYSWYGDDSDN